MRHPKPTLLNTFLMVGSILIVSMFVAMIYSLIQDARERADYETTQYGACIANNARFSAIAMGFRELYEADLLNPSVDEATRQSRLSAYRMLESELQSLQRDCPTLYPTAAREDTR